MPSIFLLNKQNWGLRFWFLGALVNVAGNILLIPRAGVLGGIMGASVATAIAYFIMMICLVYKNLTSVIIKSVPSWFLIFGTTFATINWIIPSWKGPFSNTFGYEIASDSWRYKEVSWNSPARIQIYFFKSLIPLAGGLLILQGISESMRCILCIRDGEWMKRHEDVRETEEDLISRKKEEERQRKALGN